MIKIHFPSTDFKIKQQNNTELIFDIVRKKWVTLTPEEWVRQNFIQYLIQQKKYPAKLLSVEKKFLLNGLSKRCDIIVYHQSKPWMIIECKQMEQTLNDAVVEQVLRYHQAMPVDFLVITNGAYTLCFKKAENDFLLENNFPEYP